MQQKKKYTSPKVTYSSNNKYDLSRGFDKKNKQKMSWSFAGWGAVGALLIAVFLFVLANAKLMDKPYVSVAYWLETFADFDITIPLDRLFSVIPAVDLPDWLTFAEVPINFLTSVLNLFVGSVGVLINVLEMMLYFIGKFVLFVSG